MRGRATELEHGLAQTRAVQRVRQFECLRFEAEEGATSGAFSAQLEDAKLATPLFARLERTGDDGECSPLEMGRDEEDERGQCPEGAEGECSSRVALGARARCSQQHSRTRAESKEFDVRLDLDGSAAIFAQARGTLVVKVEPSRATASPKPAHGSVCIT